MRRFPSKPKQLTDLLPMLQPKEPDPLVSDISIDRLIDQGRIALHREMKNLLSLSAIGKLESPMAKDLRDTIKLLFELKSIEDQSLKDLDDDQLEALISGPEDDTK